MLLGHEGLPCSSSKSDAFGLLLSKRLALHIAKASKTLGADDIYHLWSSFPRNFMGFGPLLQPEPGHGSAESEARHLSGV